jgi:hypothetical protein
MFHLRAKSARAVYGWARLAVIASATFATLFLLPLYRTLGAPKVVTAAPVQTNVGADRAAKPAPAVGPAAISTHRHSATGDRGAIQEDAQRGGPTAAAGAAAGGHREWELVADANGEACRTELTALGIKFRALPDRAEPDRDGCGIPHGVLVTRGPRGIVYAPPLQIDCSLARELVWIEDVVQKEAEAELGSQIKQITTFGTYSCRRVRGGFTGRLSEHAVGNAIDFGAFAPKRGTAVSVARDYRPREENPGPRGVFLRRVFWALRGHGRLSHVIGPETRADHHDHVHIDRGEPWWHFADRLFGG